ncbi:MAG: transposase [Gemmataceae bacterium]|nr:transposase [Gemmataceae bacterium]
MSAEAARVQPELPRAPAHDAFTRLLERLEPEPAILREEARPRIRLGEGVLVFDDTVLDKPYARKIDLVGRHWSGKHKRVVQGIDLVSMAWTDGDRIAPCDCRICHDKKEATKNDHFRAMADAAQERGSRPECVLFDGWCSSLENLKRLRDEGWRWLTRLKCNRLVRKDRGRRVPCRAPRSPRAGRRSG